MTLLLRDGGRGSPGASSGYPAHHRSPPCYPTWRSHEGAAFDLTLNFDRPTEGLVLIEGLRTTRLGAAVLTRAFLLFQLKRYEEVVPTAGRALQLRRNIWMR